jgi:glutamate-1-semialdehyde 2,1-aminomutase
MKIIAIIQARMGSTRLPGKVMKKINGKTIIEILISRLMKSNQITDIVVATSVAANNIPLVDHVKNLGYNCEQGSENNVLKRYYDTAIKHSADIIVRITGDCPFVDYELVDDAISQFTTSGVDYITNGSPPSYPDGLDIEVFSIEALEKANKEASTSYDIEHVTPYIRESNKFKTKTIRHSIDLSAHRWTLDESEDLEVISNIFNYFNPDIHFSWKKIIDLHSFNPALFQKNDNIERNEGAIMGKGQKLYKRAKKVIPGGNMLLSKRPEMFLPNLWPSYFSKAKGCKVWDLDGNEFIDMCIMGIGTNSLGYGNSEIDDAVQANISKGNMSTFNCPEEVYLAERLVEMHDWADMARFARSGGEANAIAIRIARAASGKDNVAVCGYHGWHDWYLSANLKDKSKLDNLLLPGLDIAGVPKNLKGTVFPFQYNDFEHLKFLVENSNIGVIKMEVLRNDEPKNNFLQKVRALASDKGIVLIFDECTSGFRETYGGMHKKYNVNPDMAMFGKAMGNGYAITGVIGKREIMEAAQDTFISSTFWTERIGPTAALKTLEVMEKQESWKRITDSGNFIRQELKKLANETGLKITQWGIPALTGYSFESKNAAAYKTLVTQEMLKKGFLAGNSVYVCTEHSKEIINSFLESLEPIFMQIKKCEDGQDVNQLLDGPVCHTGFSRLN